MSDKTKKIIATTSDLHLLALCPTISVNHVEEVESKHVQEQIKLLVKTAKQADVFVLNGDIFEFIFPSCQKNEVTEKAVRFLKELAAVNPACEFHYVLGNHDCCSDLVNALQDREIPNLAIHTTHWKSGDMLFTHGDIPLRTHKQSANGQVMQLLRMYREPEETHSLVSRNLYKAAEMYDDNVTETILSVAYHTENAVRYVGSAMNAAVVLFMRKRAMPTEEDIQQFEAKNNAHLPVTVAEKAPVYERIRTKKGEFYSYLQKRVQRLIDTWKDPEADARKIAKNLMDENASVMDGVKHIFTGHTHIPYFDIAVKVGSQKHEIHMHNTGSTLQGARSNVMLISTKDKKFDDLEPEGDLHQRIGDTGKKIDKIAEKWTKSVEEKVHAGLKR